jgi:hypothetical protein
VSPAFEAFLARLYVDAEARAAFLADPRAAARGLAPDEVAALERIDRVGLELAADSFAHKRAAKAAHARPRRPSLVGRWLRALTGGPRGGAGTTRS